MINLSEITKDNIIKVLVEDEDQIEEECWATVIQNNNQKLYVKYLEPCNKFYKQAPLYEVSENLNEVEVESLIEHHETHEDAGFNILDESYYYIMSDVESDDSESDIYEEDSSEESFIAPEDVSEWQKPHDHARVDSDWNSWVPRTVGEQHFKDRVDRIETFAKLYEDEMKFQQ